MKGLLKNNFMGVLENIKILIPLVLLFGILVSATGSASLLGIFSSTLTPALLVLVVLCLRKESLSKWYKYKISLPVKRNQIVQSYYISHVCWCVAGMIVVTIFMTITILIHGNQYFYYGFRDAFTLCFRRRDFGNVYWFCFLSALLFSGCRKNRNHSNSKCYYFSGNSCGNKCIHKYTSR